MNPGEAEVIRLAEAGMPGTFIYVANKDGSSEFYTAGYADLESRTTMSPTMHYRIGSTTKTFTAVVVLQLIEEGKFGFGDTMQALLPDLPIPNAEMLTVEHLLRMRSGLFDFEDDPSLLGSLEAHFKPTTLAQTIEYSIRQPAEFMPGEMYTYCNTNFCMLEVIVERVTGRSLAEEFEERIFDPLGLKDTTYPGENDLTLPEPYIRGYEWTQDGWQECSEVFFGRGDGAIISTAVDVGRFFRGLLLDRKLLSDEMLGKMMSVVEDEPPAPEKYGLGLMTSQVACGPVWGHSGGGFGYAHAPYIRLDNGRFAIMMRNASFGFRTPVAPELAEKLRFATGLGTAIYCADQDNRQ